MVINKISVKLTNFLVKTGIIDCSDDEVYIYGFELCISSVISVLIILALAIASGMYIESILFYAVFCVTRLYSGGLHAETYLKCKLLFAFTFSLTLGICYVLEDKAIEPLIWIIVFALSSAIIIWFAPLENPNKGLTEVDKKRAKRITVFILLTWLIIAYIMFSLKMCSYIIIPLTLLSVMVLMVLGQIKQRRRVQ